MKNFTASISFLALCLLGTQSYAAVFLPPSATLTSTNNQFRIYEAGIEGTVFYYLDILNEPTTTQVSSFAVSFRSAVAPEEVDLLFGGISAGLGTNSGSGTFDKSEWSNYSSVAFETVFGLVDNAFIYVKGSLPVTTTTDVDGSDGLTAANFTAYRVDGVFDSEFVVFGPSGNILGSSQPIPEPTVSIFCGLAALGFGLRRRRAS